MTEIDRLVADTSNVLRGTLIRLSRLARTLLIATTLVSLATYATGTWLLDSSGWRIGGFILCASPVAAAFLGWWRLRRVAFVLPKAFDDLAVLFADQRARSAIGIVIDHDTGQQVGPTTLNLAGMRGQLLARKDEMPALYDTVRAVMTVPGLAAVATAGLIGLGMLGTIMLLVGLVT